MVMGWVWSGFGQTLLFFIDSDSDPDPKGLKFSDPDPSNLMGLRSLMGLKKSILFVHLNFL